MKMVFVVFLTVALAVFASGMIQHGTAEAQGPIPSPVSPLETPTPEPTRPVCWVVVPEEVEISYFEGVVTFDFGGCFLNSLDLWIDGIQVIDNAVGASQVWFPVGEELQWVELVFGENSSNPVHVVFYRWQLLPMENSVFLPSAFR